MAKMAPEAAPRSLFAATEKERALLVNSLTRTQTPSGKPESPLKHAVIAPDVIHFNFSESKRFSSSSALLDSFLFIYLILVLLFFQKLRGGDQGSGPKLLSSQTSGVFHRVSATS